MTGVGGMMDMGDSIQMQLMMKSMELLKEKESARYIRSSKLRLKQRARPEKEGK
jgi:hypothetical protein